MATVWGDDEIDVMDGLDEEPVPDATAPSQEEAPVPGYISAEGDVLPGSPEAVAQQAEEDYSAVMTQVDRRMKVANYFRMVLDNDLFPDGTPEAHLAETRIRKFVREELEVLLGMRNQRPETPVAEQQFTDEEVALLRELIKRVSKPAAVVPQFKAVKAEPAPAAPKFKPVTAASVVPAPKKPLSTPAPVVQKPSPAVTRPPVAAKTTGAGVDPRIPPQYRADPTAIIKDGQVFVQARNEDGLPLWSQEKGSNKRKAIMKNVTPVAQPPSTHMPLPMPSFATSNQIETQRAGAALGAIERMGKLAGGFLLQSLTNNKGEDENG